MLVSGITETLGNQLQPLRCSMRFDHWLSTNRKARAKDCEGSFGWSERFSQKIGESRLVCRNAFRFEEHSVPNTPHDNEPYPFVGIGTGRYGFCDIVRREPHVLRCCALLLREENVSGDVSGLASPLTMLIAILRLTCDGGFPIFSRLRPNWNQIRPLAHVDCWRLPAILKSLFQSENGITVWQKGKRRLYYVRGKHPGPLGQFKFLLRSRRLCTSRISGFLGGLCGSNGSVARLSGTTDGLSRYVNLFDCDYAKQNGDENKQSVENNLESFFGYPHLERLCGAILLILGAALAISGMWLISEYHFLKGAILVVIVFPVTFAAVTGEIRATNITPRSLPYKRERGGVAGISFRTRAGARGDCRTPR